MRNSEIKERSGLFTGLVSRWTRLAGGRSPRELVTTAPKMTALALWWPHRPRLVVAVAVTASIAPRAFHLRRPAAGEMADLSGDGAEISDVPRLGPGARWLAVACNGLVWWSQISPYWETPTIRLPQGLQG